MNYVERHLNPGEVVVHRTTLHPIVFLMGTLISVIGLVFVWQVGPVGLGGLAAIILLVGVLALLVAWLRYASSEFAVTTTRVIMKVGWLSTHTLELQLSKVEALSVDQALLGRIFDYGTLVVGGTGGTKEAFKFIKAPIVFRQQVQQQTEVASSPVARATGALGAAPAAGSRAERECPFCAERILAKATRCRFCGQTVVPVG